MVSIHLIPYCLLSASLCSCSTVVSCNERLYVFVLLIARLCTQTPMDVVIFAVYSQCPFVVVVEWYKQASAVACGPYGFGTYWLGTSEIGTTRIFDSIACESLTCILFKTCQNPGWGHPSLECNWIDDREMKVSNFRVHTEESICWYKIPHSGGVEVERLFGKW